MTINVGIPCNYSTSKCVDTYGCPANVVPDFCIKRHDTKPVFKMSLEDCDGPFDLTEDGLILEVNMWANAKFKTKVVDSVNYFALADNIGFNQVMVGDLIIVDQARLPEHMLVTGFDETNKLIQVERGYNGTTAVEWAKGTSLKIFRILNGTGSIETVLDDLMQEDGSILEDQVVNTFLVYEWTGNNTCLPGCYWLEFKLLKMEAEVESLSIDDNPSVIPSFTPSHYTPSDFGCGLGLGVEWVRRFPSTSEGFLIRILGTPTGEF